MHGSVAYPGMVCYFSLLRTINKQQQQHLPFFLVLFTLETTAAVAAVCLAERLDLQSERVLDSITVILVLYDLMQQILGFILPIYHGS